MGCSRFISVGVLSRWEKLAVQGFVNIVLLAVACRITEAISNRQAEERPDCARLAALSG